MKYRARSFKYVCLFFALVFCSVLPAQDFYWEKPVPLTASESRFPAAAYNKTADTSVVVWQDVHRESDRQGTIWLSAYVYKNGQWIRRSRFAGPFPYTGEVPNIFSTAVNADNVITVAVLSDAKTISVFASDDSGFSFTETKIVCDGDSLVAPRIFRSSGGGFILFATQGNTKSFSLKTARSPDGKKWSAFTDFSPTRNLINSFVPDFTVISGEREMAVFQSIYAIGNRATYQLYSSYSDDGGNTWSEPHLVTDSGGTKANVSEYTNQRPFLHMYGGVLYLIWERSRASSDKSVITVAPLNNEGAINGSLEQLSPRSSAAYQPVLFTYKNALTALWVDTRRGVENIYMAVKKGRVWDENRISLSGLYSVFGTPLVTGGGDDLHIFWEQERGKAYSVVRLSADRSVLSPALTGVSFENGQRANGSKLTARIQVPQDPSGISSYSWIVTQDKDAEPPETFMEFPSKNSISAAIKEDGLWYLKAKAMDNAGNWSQSAVLTYFRDTTAPEPPQIQAPVLSDDGYMHSNTFELAWQNADSQDEVVSGYTYTLQYLASVKDFEHDPQKYTQEALSDFKVEVPAKIIGTRSAAAWNNIDNGVYLFAVAAVDAAGNIGKSALLPIYLNKYIPYTIVTAVSPRTDVYGTTYLDIFGKGFSTDGLISTVYLDKDGLAPYDITFKYDADGFKVSSDTKLSGITFSDLDSGRYRVGLVHPVRGLYMSAPLLDVSESGTVKAGNFDYRFEPSWKEYTEKYRYTVQVSDIVLWAVIIFTVIGLFFVMRHLLITVQEGFTVQREVHAFISGDSMMTERKQKARELKQRGISLKFKMMFFISVLVLLLTLLVSAPLGVIFIRTQESTLAKGLEDRISVLMESLSAGVKNHMPGQNILELGLLLNQTQSMPEIRYATILGLAADNRNTNVDYVWASTDPNIAEKIDSDSLVLGSSRFVHEEIAAIVQRTAKLNEEAEKSIGSIASDIVSLTAEGVALALKTDRISIERRNEIQQVNAQLTQTLTLALTDLSKNGSGSFPEFDNVRLSRDVTEYLFYKPVLYRRGTEQVYVRAIVLLKVSTEDLIETVHKASMTVSIIASTIALFAVLIGVVGSLVLASIIIKPIRRLASHVVMIRDTGDKADLAGKDIPVTAGDEIGLLSENVNDMTHALVEAAINANMLLGGKEVQRAFLPLDEVSIGGKQIKQSVGHLDTSHVQFFGYYEGAKGVSGDYFDYRKLDSRHFAVIKVDVSGKGSPAALIMAEVAALFTEYFNGWSVKKNGTDLSPLVYKINDHLVNRNLFGKFAAFTLAIFDSVAGDFYFCNAGDNLIHIYDASEAQKKIITLTPTPTAGAFPSGLVEMKGGYPVQKVHLDAGDILFLYTDGIEEAKRLYRDQEGVALKFRDGTDISVSTKDEDGYKKYIRLCNEQQNIKKGKAYINFERNVSEDLLQFLHEKSKDISDPKKYLAGLQNPELWATEYIKEAFKKGQNINESQTVAAVKRYNRFIASKELIHFIKHMDADVYDYIMYMNEKGASVVDGEEFSAERVHDIIEAVFKQKTYSLAKRVSPLKFSEEKTLEFNFSDCEGTPEEGIMALIAVEKVFRMYKSIQAGPYDHAVVDKKIDAFLKRFFVQYPVYCANGADHFQSGLRDEYMLYTHIKEDEQFDDLTLVAIKKK